MAIKGVTIVDHPLVQHKLTLMRKKDTSIKSFRQLLKEIGGLVCYEVTRDLPLEMVGLAAALRAMAANSRCRILVSPAVPEAVLARPVHPVACVTQSRQDVAVVVQRLVHRGGPDADARMVTLELGDALG